MTSTKPPNTPGSRRAVPRHTTPRQAELLRDLLLQEKRWILRPSWHLYLADRIDLDDGREVGELSRDQRIAAVSWLTQQQHRLYEVVEGGRVAPDGWLESLPLHAALRR